MLKFKAVKKKGVDEKINEKYLDFEAVLNRVQNSVEEKHLSVKVYVYRWAMAACVLVFISFITYAWLNQPAKYQPKKITVSKKTILQDTLALTSFHIPVREDALITTEDSLVIFIGSNILEPMVGPDTSEVMVSRVARMVHDESKGICFYISFKKLITNKATANIFILIPHTDSIQALYGGPRTENKTWKTTALIDQTLPIIKEPSPSMLAYQRYKDSKILLDSIDTHYHLKDGFYGRAGSKGFRYEQKFIRKLRKEIKSYHENSQFEINVKEAVYSWNLYNEQHQLKITRSKMKNNRKAHLAIPIHQEGWYGVIYGKK